MIRSDSEYKEALKRLDNDQSVMTQKKQQYTAMNLTPDQIKTLLEPEVSFHEQLKDEVLWYENVIKGHIEPLRSITDLGKGLIALRIAAGLTQSELAEALGVAASQICRDEKNDYRGISIDRAQKIFDTIQLLVMGSKRTVKRKIVISLEPEEPHKDLACV